MKFRLVQLAVVMAATAGVVQASPVSFFDQPLGTPPAWNVGAGQANEHFSGARDSAFSGGALELGLRAQERGAGAYTPTLVNSAWGTLPMYTTVPGFAPGTSNRAVWNFDYSVFYAGGVGNLDSTSLRIDPVSGNLTDLIDITPNALNGPNAFQDSVNPGFGFLSGGYNYNATSLYLITLSATENGQTVSTQMLINVGGVAVPTPEPVSLVVFGGLIVGGAGVAVRRWKKAAVA